MTGRSFCSGIWCQGQAVIGNQAGQRRGPEGMLLSQIPVRSRSCNRSKLGGSTTPWHQVFLQTGFFKLLRSDR